MSLLMVLKIFSDCCICFAIIGSGPITFDIPLLVPAFVCGLAAGLAAFFYKKEWNIARWLCGLLPQFCLLFGKNSEQILLLAVPAIYTSGIIFLEKLELEYYSYSRFFKQSLMLLGGAYLVTNIWLFLSAATGEASLALDGDVIIRYGLVHLFCGIVLQRQLRLGVDYSSKSNRRQIPVLLGVAAVIALSFVTAEPFLRKHFLQLIEYVLMMFGVPVFLLIELLSKLISWFANKDHSVEIQSGQQQGTEVGGGMTPIPNVTVPKEEIEAAANTTDPIYIWAAVITVLLAVAAIILYRSFQKQRFFGNTRDLKSTVVVPPKKKRDSVLSNRYKVRQLYREFLRLENGRGLKLKCSDTSEDVLHRIHPETNKKSAADLRQVYLAARYDGRKSVSRSQVNAAKQALKGTKSGKN